MKMFSLLILSLLSRLSTAVPMDLTTSPVVVAVVKSIEQQYGVSCVFPLDVKVGRIEFEARLLCAPKGANPLGQSISIVVKGDVIFRGDGSPFAPSHVTSIQMNYVGI